MKDTITFKQMLEQVSRHRPRPSVSVAGEREGRLHQNTCLKCGIRWAERKPRQFCIKCKPPGNAGYEVLNRLSKKLVYPGPNIVGINIKWKNATQLQIRQPKGGEQELFDYLLTFGVLDDLEQQDNQHYYNILQIPGALKLQRAINAKIIGMLNRVSSERETLQQQDLFDALVRFKHSTDTSESAIQRHQDNPKIKQFRSILQVPGSLKLYRAMLRFHDSPVPILSLQDTQKIIKLHNQGKSVEEIEDAFIILVDRNPTGGSRKKAFSEGSGWKKTISARNIRHVIKKFNNSGKP